MKPFTLDAGMTATVGGAFYPTDHSFVMFKNAADAESVGRALLERGFGGDDVYLIPPATVLSQIGPTVHDADNPLPSAGTEGATARAYVQLAREGQTALMVRTPDAGSAERLMEEVRRVPYSIAQRYRALVIEDL